MEHIKAELAAIVIRHLHEKWYQKLWDIDVTSYRDDGSGIMMATSMDNKYKNAEIAVNEARGETYGDIVAGVRHEMIHLTQASFVDYFEVINSAIGENNPLAANLIDRMAMDMMEHVVAQVEIVLSSTTEGSVKYLCDKLFSKLPHDPILPPSSPQDESEPSAP